MKISPDVVGVKPTIQLRAVVFPAPLCPKTAKISPGKISKDKSSTATFPSRKTLRRWWIDKAGWGSDGDIPGAMLEWKLRLLHMYFGIKQKYQGLAFPYAPCHVCPNHQSRNASKNVSTTKKNKAVCKGKILAFASSIHGKWMGWCSTMQNSVKWRVSKLASDVSHDGAIVIPHRDVLWSHT